MRKFVRATIYIYICSAEEKLKGLKVVVVYTRFFVVCTEFLFSALTRQSFLQPKESA